ncbi:mycofactocin radical SAM maturase [Ferrithrix thermotolerans DSM 19514]|uniref:Mycofactocin maturase MftC n=1 Tax=Ferrithrix thermotolerans DSM 19514 TaxID=1121881 RepID=A0A1M4WHP4_9ACTN|nr:mycofactocin radical SAM maturase [Ferrithrix thermotolerans]SHE80492.1 mycofactocin radical SAM maturase [Ferrithrix thermotolerans DSM 19514]
MTHEHTAFSRGLSSPICLTWELTYACNLACSHCLSSSGRKDPRELSTEEAKGLIDQFKEMDIFYINIGGGEPTVRSDFKEVVSYALDKGIGVKFSTNGTRIDQEMARWIASEAYLDVQVSLDGPREEQNDSIRGDGSFKSAIKALESLQRHGATSYKISSVVTKVSIGHLDELYELSNALGAQLRLTRLRPSGRASLIWSQLNLDGEDQRYLYRWLREHPEVLTGDSFFHLNPLGDALEGLNICGAGRVVCLIDPVGDVYACPFVIHESFLAGNVRELSFKEIWQTAPTFETLRQSREPRTCSTCSALNSCHGGCMAAKFFGGLGFDDPDPNCVFDKATSMAEVKAFPMPDLSRSRPIYIRPRIMTKAVSSQI